jgi:predicted protein tyrosine phosphatase
MESVTGQRDAATIVVCPLSQVERLSAELGVGHVLTLLGEPAKAVTPAGVTDHLVVNIHDIVITTEAQILAESAHVQQVIDFARAWDGATPMLVHCFAGISRSTASAFIVACVKQPGRDEREIAQAIRDASATASPNRHLVALADDLLGREGRMVAAIERIGVGEPAPEGIPFTLQVSLPAEAGGGPAS